MKFKRFNILLIAFLSIVLTSCSLIGRQADINGNDVSTTTMPPLTSHQVPDVDMQADIEFEPTVVKPDVSTAKDGEMTVRMVDVEHGECILIISPNGKVMLIDTGESANLKYVRTALEDAKIEKIDILVLTHPHSDHIGNAAWIVRNYPVGEVHMIGKAHTTKIYSTLLDTLEEYDSKVVEIVAGKEFELDGMTCKYLAPLRLNYRGLNNCSAVMRMQYGEKSFLFTGDLEIIGENDIILKYGNELKSDYLNVGHHATNSTQQRFAELVQPEVSTISSLPFKTYAHPERKLEIVDRLEKMGSQVFWTGNHGDINVYCDGKTFRIEHSREPDDIDSLEELKNTMPPSLGELSTEPLQ